MSIIRSILLMKCGINLQWNKNADVFTCCNFFYDIYVKINVVREREKHRCSDSCT